MKESSYECPPVSCMGHVHGPIASVLQCATHRRVHSWSSQVKCIYTGTYLLFPTHVLTLAFCQSYFAQLVRGDTVRSIYPLYYVGLLVSTPMLSTSWKGRGGTIQVYNK